MSKTVRIFVACVVGAFIGSIIALQVYQMFWWVGATIGAFVAYLGYNIEEVVATIPVTYRSVRGWRPDYPAWRAKLKIGFASLGIAQTLLSGVLALAWPILVPEFYLLKAFWILALGFPAFMFVVMFMTPCRQRDGELNDFVSYWDVNPVSVFLWHLPRGLFFGTRWLVFGIPTAIKACVAFVGFSKNFTTTLFRIIHSELRLLCAVDAALGTAVGYFADNPAVGAVAGGLLGVLNYEIITVRVMKLAGAKSMFK